jgi:hypothetical protein
LLIHAWQLALVDADEQMWQQFRELSPESRQKIETATDQTLQSDLKLVEAERAICL